MAQSYLDPQIGQMIIPDSAVAFQVVTQSSNFATTGTIVFVGEAAQGPDFTLETKLRDTFFGPFQGGDVVAKYGSGALVDAFNLAADASNDPQIVGAPNRFYLVKTNPGTKASATLPKVGGGTYGTLYDKSYGLLGNMVYYTVAAKTSETKPTTGAFTYIPPVGTIQIGLRVNGAAEVNRTGSAAETPTAFVSGVTALTGISATGGGVNRTVLSSTHGSLAVAATGTQATVTLTAISNWDVTPTVGDTMVVPAGSAIAGAGNANVGAYVVTSVSATVIVGSKLSDAAKSGAAIGTVTSPVAVSASAVAGANADLVCYSPVTITQSSVTVIDGVGKVLAIDELTGGTDLLSRAAFQLGTTTPATWVSKTSAPQQLNSAAEYSVTLAVARQADGVTEPISAGGAIAVQVGYAGTDCTVVVAPTTMTLTPTGGSGVTLTINLSNFPTLNDLVAYIGAQTGYSAAIGTPSLGQSSPLMLDEGTFRCSTTYGGYGLRLKVDATAFFRAISTGSNLVQLGSPAVTAAAGLPDVSATPKFLSGGARGATTDTVVTAALAALERVQTNFVVPLFSRDATADIADGLTDSASTYTIASVHAAARSHCLKVSTPKVKRFRQAFLAYRGTFAGAQAAAQAAAAFRETVCLQDVIALGQNGLQQFQPHMLAAMAAGMQAAAFYKGLTRKVLNISGVTQAAGDFDDGDNLPGGDVETALLAGLLVARQDDDGSFYWVSDQTTYGRDNNYYYNSVQAVYAGDIVFATVAQRMAKAFVGQSQADADSVLSIKTLAKILDDMKDAKLLASSEDAPAGYRKLSVTVNGPVMAVKGEVKIAGTIYFLPINFTVTQVTNSATAA